jgi:hypothetical protein
VPLAVYEHAHDVFLSLLAGNVARLEAKIDSGSLNAAFLPLAKQFFPAIGAVTFSEKVRSRL